MGMFTALDVSQEETAICVVRQDGTHVAEAKVPTCPDAIADWLADRTEGLERVGMETGPLAVWLWNALTERHDARGLAQIVRTGWFKAAQIKSHDAYVNRAMLTAREALVGMRVRLENEIRDPRLRDWAKAIAERTGPRKARVALARKLAITLHAMWRTNTPFREVAMA